MPTLEYYFGVSIGIIIFSMTDNLSKTLQKQRMSSIQGQQMAMSTKEAILQMRNDATFDLFYKGILEKAQKHGIVEPEPSRRKVPKFLHDYFGYSDTYVPETVKDSYRVMYFEIMDLAVTAITERFDQPGFKVFSQMEQFLLECVQADQGHLPSDFSLFEVNYPGDIKNDKLRAQIPIFQILLKEKECVCFKDIYDEIKKNGKTTMDSYIRDNKSHYIDNG